MIDIIIPIYNIDIKQLRTCLSSIISQTILEELEVTIVDDGSFVQNEELEIMINKMRNFIPIQFLRYENNRGPGYARQYGIDHTNNEYILFIDADDMLTPIATEVLLKALQQQPDKAVAVAEFYALDTKSMQIEKTGIQLTWVFAKLYRREIIDKYNFHFNVEEDCSYANEDVGFNVQYQYVLGDSCLVLIEQPLYYWSDRNRNSITRNNNYEYKYKQGHKGYVMNFIRTYKKLKDVVSKERRENYAFKHLIDIYRDYSKNWVQIQENNLNDELLEYSYLYYREVFKEFDNVNKDVLKKYWEIYCSDKIKGFDHFLRYLIIIRNNA